MAEQDILEITREVVADGTLDERGVETILAAARERSAEQPLTTKERSKIMSIVRDRTKGLAFSKIHLPLRILSIFLIVTGLLGIISGVVTLLSMFGTGYLANELKEVTATTAAVVIIAAVCSFISALLSFFVGLRLWPPARLSS